MFRITSKANRLFGPWPIHSPNFTKIQPQTSELFWSQTSRHLGTIPQLCRAISSQLRHISTIGKKMLSSNISSTCPHNMVNFGPQAAEICWRVWAPLQISMAFASWQRYCTAFQYWASAKLCGVKQRVPPATYIPQDGHHVGHWPTFLVINITSVILILI